MKNLNIDSPNTRVVSIKVNHMKSRGNSDVKVVKIADEKIVYLPQGFGSFFPAIDALYVFDSQLQHLNRRDFVGVEKLKSISFYKNQIADIPDDALADLTVLRFLSFNGNQISKIPLILLHNLLILEEVSFRFNYITHVSANIFANNKKLRVINFNHNKIVGFSADLVYLPSLKQLYLNQNECIDSEVDFEVELSRDLFYDKLLQDCDEAVCAHDHFMLADCTTELEACEAAVNVSLNEINNMQSF